MILKPKTLIKYSTVERIKKRNKGAKDKAKKAEPSIWLRTNTARIILKRKGRLFKRTNTTIKDQARIKGQTAQHTREETRSD